MRLGDTIAKVTKTVGIEPCAPCEERRKMLNELSEKMLVKIEAARALLKGKKDETSRTPDVGGVDERGAATTVGTTDTGGVG